ncbi:OmpW family outer membrane protein [Rhodanobacter sp. 115]|jgi:outer membrane protein|uniref:OmpW/AlkL family protein n=1 Tax=Rhodanobacter sp. FW021-MT20 TaxID=1162282 RepID=UPI000260DB60|nr:OmpW family outer membrane protein [Rhodanobacter sp. 115]EIL91126.1 OmpW family protein [Rhodanobacter sp. 115]
MKAALPLLVAAAFATASVSVARADDSHWVVRIGAHVVDPASDNGHLAGMKTGVGDSTRPTGSIEYLVTPNWGVEALAALPFKHEVKLDGVKAARTRQLPPVIGVNYHFLPDAAVSPFVGAGLNYTYFFDTKGKGLLQGAHVKADDSWGAAAHAGIDITLSSHWLLTADVRWIDIRSDIHVNGAKVGTAKIDPWVYGLSFGYRF